MSKQQKKTKKKDPKCIGYIINLDDSDDNWIGLIENETELEEKLEELADQDFSEDEITVYKVLRKVKVRIGKEEPEPFGYVDE